MRDGTPRREGGGVEERDLGEIVLSRSVQEIMDDDLYKGQVRA